MCDVALLSHGIPYGIPELPSSAAGMAGWGEGGWFGNRFIAISSMLRIATGELAPRGKLPIAVGEFPIGHGLDWNV